MIDQRTKRRALLVASAAVVCAALVAVAGGLLSGGRDDPPETPVESPVRGSGPAAGPTSTRLVLLGTGTPSPDPGRSGPALAVVVGDTPYLVDLGSGVSRQVVAAQLRGIGALDLVNVRRAFVTHLHSDHTTGYAELLFARWALGADTPLRVWGPPGTEEMTAHILEAYEKDIDVRLYGLQPATRLGYRAEAHDSEPGVVYRDDRVTVEAYLVDHGSWPVAFGYKFTTADREICVSGDTAPSDNLVEHCRGVDILVHEVFSEAGWERLSPDWQRYHHAFHSSSTEVAETASEVRPGLLVLYHQLHWGVPDEELLAEVEAAYDGPVVYGRDLDVF